MPRVAGLRRHIETVIVERGEGVGPYRGERVGEGARNLICGGAVAAVAQAADRWADRLPLTTERVWRIPRSPGSRSAGGEPVIDPAGTRGRVDPADADRTLAGKPARKDSSE